MRDSAPNQRVTAVLYDKTVVHRTHPNTYMQALAQLAEAIGSTTKKTQKVAFLADYLRSVDENTAALSALYLSGRVFAAWEERTLQVGGAQLWRTLLTICGKSDAALTAAFRRHGDLGAGAYDVLLGIAPETPTLTVLEVARTFDAIATARGPAPKGELLRTLLSRATALEAKYLIKIMTGELRIGLKESLVEEATAKAFDASLADVKRANMLLGDIGETVRLAIRNQLSEARMRLFHPIGFMLATPAEDAVAAFDQFTEAIVEDKYDGIRAQAHVCPARAGDPGRIKIYSRTLDEISESFPELPPALVGLMDEAILDGEILAWRDGRAMAFSELQKRLGRKRVTHRTISDVPVAYVVFDILALNGELVIDRPLRERRELVTRVLSRLRPAVPRPTAQGVLVFETAAPQAESMGVLLAPALRATSAEHLDELFAAAQDRGNEGLMIKNATSPYTPGRRGQSWLKLKRELATLDVVVTAAEYGNGRRAGVLSDYTFAVRSGNKLVNVGKAYNGLTDVEIAEMSDWFKRHTVADYGHVRTVEPKVVIEVAFNAVMKSDRHDSGFALRFPRIVRLRPDKPVSEIDTIERVEHIYSNQIHLRKTA